MRINKHQEHLKFDQYIFLLLLAFEVIVSFTFLGYVHIPPISITTAYVPVIVAGCIFGPRESVLTGLVFGLVSMYKASAFYVLPNDMLFSPFRSGSPLASLTLSIGSRVAFGFLVGILFHFSKKRKHVLLWNGVVALISPALYAVLVYMTMEWLFPDRGFTHTGAMRLDATHLAVEMLCLASVELLYVFYQSDFIQKYRIAVDRSHSSPYISTKIFRGLSLFGLCIIAIAACAAFYFSDRMTYMLGTHQVAISETIRHDVLLLQLQFFLAMLALDFMLLLMIMLVYRYMKYKEYQGEMDALTDVMGRRLFWSYIEQQQKSGAALHGQIGWFLFLDVDNFKQINDSLGHAAGDIALKSVANKLRTFFDGSGVVGRLGGDEFAVMVEQPLSRSEMESRLNRFLESLPAAEPQGRISCSIGALYFTFPQEADCLLSETDVLLYQAKEKGKGCYIMKM